MMKMFRTDIAKQDKEARAQIFKAKKEEKAVVKQVQPHQNTESSPKGQNNNLSQSSKRFRRNKRKGNFTGQGQQRNYPQKRNNQENEGKNTDYPVCVRCGKKHPGTQNPPYPSRNINSQLHAVQARIEGPSIAQGRLEAPEPQARIYAYPRGDAEAGTSHMVTGQISIATHDATALFDLVQLTHLYLWSCP
ncbi:hypothetical protein TIFTF001_041601 [Ficus carica]|uniref:Uncharacterized protein n=1 Tax=Ficus carica TaxID=3494 RepID=A0AA87ZCJ7_FICCA|nr:hypothetical protein TIFTF001_041598 [Ficus carica]GMN31487.1 hypothetical protein TIFTF001_041601 [Ficus carica]